MTLRSAIGGRQSAMQARRGIALVDVIIGGVLLSMGLAVVISLSARSLRTQTDSEKQLTAAWLADEFLNMVLVEGPVNYPKLYDSHGRCAPPFEEFEYDVLIEDQGMGVPLRVTSTVYWEGAGGLRNVQVQTLIGDRGIEPNELRAPYETVDRINRWYEIYEKQK
jgi:hypothetical protein